MNENADPPPPNYLNAIADNVSVALFRFRLQPAPGFVYLNNAICILTGYPLQNFIENPGFLKSIVDPKERPWFEQMLSDPTDGAAVLRLICRDGMIRDFDFHYVHARSLDGQILALDGTIHNRLTVPVVGESGQDMSVNDRIRYYAEKLKTASSIGMTLAEKLSLQDIYTLLTDSIIELFPDLLMVTIARYYPEAQQLICVSANIGHETMDVSQFPPAALEPPGIGTQSEAVHTRAPVIIPNLMERYKKVKKVVLIGTEEGGTNAPQSALCVPLLSKGEVLGVIQMQSPVLNRFTAEDAEMLSIVANTAAVAIHNATLVENLSHSSVTIQAAYDATLEGFSRALEMRDEETEGHTRRVAELTLNFGTHLHLDESLLVDLWRGAFLHDIGKIGVPDAILKKAGPLNDEEWVLMRAHAEIGYHILSDVPFLKNSLEIPRYHHEKWDGSGYPFGLKGEQIPLSARLFAIVDVWDALLSDRPYRKAWSREKALAYLHDASGTHFDPRLVIEFLGLVET